jgi:hypothetical protein
MTGMMFCSVLRLRGRFETFTPIAEAERKQGAFL